MWVAGAHHMPQFPIVVPVIILGITLGSLLRTRNPTISKKKFVYATLAAGLLNVAYAYGYLLLFPTSTTTTRGTFTVRPISETVFLTASFFVAVVLVVAVLGIALLYSRARGGGETEEEPEITTNEESKLTPG